MTVTFLAKVNQLTSCGQMWQVLQNGKGVFENWVITDFYYGSIFTDTN